MNTSKLEHLAKEASEVQGAMQAAYRDERQAQGEALAALLRAVRPALPALATPMTISFEVSPATVSGSFVRLGPPKVQTGTYLTALYVSAKGDLWWIDPTHGTWSTLTPEVAGAAMLWPIEAWVGQLGLACEAVTTGKASRAAKAAKARAMRLTALAVLLEPSTKSAGGSPGDQLHAPKV